MGKQPDQVLLIEKMRETLTEREQRAVDAFMADETLEEVGKEMGVSKERVRQLTLRAMRKMRMDAKKRLHISEGEARVTVGDT